jgi:hypothetical protein
VNAKSPLLLLWAIGLLLLLHQMSGWGERRHEVMCELNLLFFILSCQPLLWRWWDLSKEKDQTHQLNSMQPRKRITFDSGNGKGNVFSFRKLEKRRKSQEIGKSGYQQA